MGVDSVTITTRSGNFRHPVVIQYKTGTKGDTGAKTVKWATFITTRAAIWPGKGKELVINDKLTMQTFFTIRIRYQPSITPAMRFLFGTRIFYILQMPNIEERNVVLDFICREDV